MAHSAISESWEKGTAAHLLGDRTQYRRSRPRVSELDHIFRFAGFSMPITAAGPNWPRGLVDISAQRRLEKDRSGPAENPTLHQLSANDLEKCRYQRNDITGRQFTNLILPYSARPCGHVDGK